MSSLWIFTSWKADNTIQILIYLVKFSKSLQFASALMTTEIALLSLGVLFQAICNSASSKFWRVVSFIAYCRQMVRQVIHNICGWSENCQDAITDRWLLVTENLTNTDAQYHPNIGGNTLKINASSYTKSTSQWINTEHNVNFSRTTV